MPADEGDLFCAGLAWTAEGDLLVVGGTTQYAFVARPLAFKKPLIAAVAPASCGGTGCSSRGTPTGTACFGCGTGCGCGCGDAPGFVGGKLTYLWSPDDSTWYRQADMAVVLSPQHASIFASHGMSRAETHRLLIERARRPLREIRRGGIWRGEAGAARWPFKVALDDDEALIPAVGDPEDLHLIVAGGSGSPASFVMHGITVASRAVSRRYDANLR